MSRTEADHVRLADKSTHWSVLLPVQFYYKLSEGQTWVCCLAMKQGKSVYLWMRGRGAEETITQSVSSLMTQKHKEYMKQNIVNGVNATQCCFVLFFFNEELTTPRVSFYPDVFLCLLISSEKEGQRNSRNIQFRQLPSRPQALYIIGKSKCALIKYVRWLWGKHHAAGKIQVHLIQDKENVFKGHANPRSFFVINRLAFCGKSNW